MKKYLTLILILILAASCLLCVNAEEAQFGIRTEQTTAAQGDTVKVKYMGVDAKGRMNFSIKDAE
jgi:polyribonucleotide nucleotidyltransferase